MKFCNFAVCLSVLSTSLTSIEAIQSSPSSVISTMHRKQPFVHNTRSFEETQSLVQSPVAQDDVESLSVMNTRGGAKKAVEVPEVANTGMKERLKIGFYFGLWYALNVIYNSKSISTVYMYTNI